jgi:hypothetical protein
MRKLENKELERKSVSEFKEAKKTPIVIILDDIRAFTTLGLYLELRIHFN